MTLVFCQSYCITKSAACCAKIIGGEHVMKFPLRVVFKRIA